MKKKVLLVGVGGFLGQALQLAFTTAGFEVLGTSSRNTKTSESFRFFDFLKPQTWPFDPETSWDAVVYCGYVLNWENEDPNLNAFQKLKLNHLRNAKHHIFISSFSVLNPHSSYAFSKLQIEELFRKDQIVRPGLIVGAGGVFGQMTKTIQKWPLVPLFDHGQQEVAWVALEDVCHFLVQSVQARQSRTDILLDGEIVSLKQMLLKVREHTQRKTLFLSVPLSPILIFFRLLAKLRLRSAKAVLDRLEGLRGNSSIARLVSQQSLVYFQTGLEKALKSMKA